MNIGIIGTGNMAKALAPLFAKAGRLGRGLRRAA